MLYMKNQTKHKHEHEEVQYHHRHDHGGKHQEHGSHGHSGHHAMMIKDFRRRFWVSLIITVPILVLSPMIQDLLGYEFALFSDADQYILFVLSTLVYFYGGWPFLTGLADEFKDKQFGMMEFFRSAKEVRAPDTPQQLELF